MKIGYGGRTLAMVLAFALIPSFLTSYTMVDSSRSAIHSSVENTVNGILDSKETTLERWLRDQIDGLATLASAPGLSADAKSVTDAATGGPPAPQAAARVSALLNDTSDPVTGLGDAMLIEAQGGRVVLCPRHTGWVGYAILNASLDEQAVAGPKVVHVPRWGPSNMPMLLCVAAVRDPSAGVVAILGHSDDNDALSQILAEPRGLGLTGGIFVVGPDGRLLTTAPGSLSPGEITPSRGVAKALQGNSGGGTYSGSSGNTVVGAYVPIEMARSVLAVEVDEKDAMAPMTTIIVTAAAAGIILTMALMVISVVVTRALVRDLGSLVKWSKEVGHGNWEAALDLGGTSEAQDLEKAFRQMVRDLQKQQAQLRAAERRYSNLFKSSLDTVFTAKPDGTITELNAAGERLLGIPRLHDGTYERGFMGLFADEVERKEFERRLEHDGAVAGFEARLQVQSGREVYALISATRRLDDSGRVTHLQGVVHDITDRKRFESALIDAKNQAEFYCDIMSHDLNNAIQGLGGYLELASLARDVDDVNEFLPAAQEQLDRASVLLRNVRRLSRMGNRQVELKPIDVRPLLEYCTRAVARTRPPGTIRFDMELPGGPIVVMAEEFLEDVFTNLLDNAIKYDKHSVKVVEVSATRVEREGGAHWKFGVKDHGSGVADRDKRTIFGRFERKALNEYGTGLGLSIVVKAAERSGGTAWVEDRVAGDYTQGACFVIELIEAPPKPVTAGGGAAPERPPAGQTI